ncbi:MAG: deoxyribodipyrimidine photo-lyase, partial [Candidatus Thorarchaeota archaeon]|nr:deoxyribodipyrimidine photo-lyase [Candidatus Thorarchaeota archaeon]
MIEPERIKLLNDKAVQSGKYVLYWMQSSQRTSYNHALGYAIHQANKYNLPLLVYFGLIEYPFANERSYSFMLQGLQDVKRALIEMGAGFTINIESPDQGIINLAKNASLVVVDCDYQRIQRKWRLNVAKSIGCLFVQVESNVVVPIELVSQKEEYTAGTIRPKIHKHLDQFLKPFKLPKIKQHAPESFHEDTPMRNTNQTLEEMSVDRTVSAVEWLKGGYREAFRHLQEFVRVKLDGFGEYRNDPSLDYSSNMSPYLHFGQISPLEIALVILGTASPGEESYLEELIVRRELSMNFVRYNDSYDSFDCLPNWARTTLDDHKDDYREHSYSRKEFEDYQTHDPYWNSAQKQLVVDGKIHG